MKYFSEILKKNYDTEQECLDAEKAALAAKTERQKDAEIVKELEEKYLDAYDTYCKGVKEFIDKYGSYKTTYKNDNFHSLGLPFTRFWNEFFI